MRVTYGREDGLSGQHHTLRDGHFRGRDEGCVLDYLDDLHLLQAASPTAPSTTVHTYFGGRRATHQHCTYITHPSQSTHTTLTKTFANAGDQACTSLNDKPHKHQGLHTQTFLQHCFSTTCDFTPTGVYHFSQSIY